jgi:hypothetical protein
MTSFLRAFGGVGAGLFAVLALVEGCSGDAGTSFDAGGPGQGSGDDAAAASSGSSSSGGASSSSGGPATVDAGSTVPEGGSSSSGAGSSSGSSGASSSSSGSGGRDAGGAVDGSVRADAGARDAASTVDTGAVDSGDPLAAARAQCLQIINQDRASLTPPSPPLTEATTAQEACVDGQAQADFMADTAHSAFGQCRESAQDECPDWPGPPSSIMTSCLALMWAEGPPPAGQDNHWLNMSNPRYTKVACGFHETPTGTWWATQDFF